MREYGWIEGQNFTLEPRYTAGKPNTIGLRSQQNSSSRRWI
jgi:hypothetical protein